jgi:transposase
MFENGDPIPEITAEFGVSKQAVYDIAKRNKKTPGDQTEGSSDATESSGDPTTVNEVIVPEGSTTGQADQETEQ